MSTALDWPIGYVSRANAAIGKMNCDHRSQDTMDVVGGGCLDAIERIPAGSVCSDDWLDGEPISTVSYRV